MLSYLIDDKDVGACHYLLLTSLSFNTMSLNKAYRMLYHDALILLQKKGECI